MSGKTEFRAIELLLLLLALGVGALWYFGRARPIEVRTRHPSQRQSVVCEQCSGLRHVTCSECAGFGSVDARDACPLCKGTGKHEWRFGDKPDAPCQRCRGTGIIGVRAKCTHCLGVGHVLCKHCGGSGRTTTLTTTSSQTVSIGYSLWERCLIFCRLPVDPNPCPQKDSHGAYPIVDKYVAICSVKRPVRITQWGEFVRAGSVWVMSAEMEALNSPVIPTSRTIEFTVENRVMQKCKVIP